jgi:alpha-1,2-mannosyltransferase
VKFPSRSDVRTHAGALCVCVAMLYGANLSTPGLRDRAGQLKGTDFIHFYVLGSLALNGQAGALYDYRAQAAHAAALVPESSGVYYLPIYGPQMSLLFAPLAALPYAWALLMWSLITTSIYALCCAAFWRICPAVRSERSTVVLLAAGSPAFFNLVAHGQNSAIALACFTAAFFALRHERRFLAGLAIGMLIYKPPLALAAACVFGFTLEWRIVGGAIVGAAAQLGAAWGYYGRDVMAAYWRSVLDVRDISPLLDIKPYQMHSLLSFWKSLVPWPDLAVGLYIASAAVMIVVTCLVWRSRAPLSLRYAALLLATALVSPHLNVYDLVVVSPALLMIGNWALERPDHPLSTMTQRLLYCAYALPLFGVLTQFTHLQLSVVAMAGLSVIVAATALRQGDVRRQLLTTSGCPARPQVC